MDDFFQILPDEQTGRDTFERYKVQAKAAGLASLKILNNSGVDKVYCEWHDDFVVRTNIDNDKKYHFYQVKTDYKKSHIWSLNDIVGFYKRTDVKEVPQKLLKSYIGKLLKHTVKFKDSCQKVTFLTNSIVHNEVEELTIAIKEDDLSNFTFKSIIEGFNSAFIGNTGNIDVAQVKSNLKKLEIQTDISILKKNDPSFEAQAHRLIFHYSEIDLQYSEAHQIIHSLLALVEKKSCRVIDPDNLTESNINEKAGIGLDELLEILSISKGAYGILVAGGDDKALKTASILQRLFASGGASEKIIESAASYKTKWDNWYRNNRHNVFNFELDLLEEEISKELKDLINNKKVTLSQLRDPLENIKKKITGSSQLVGISDEILLGGLFSALARAQ